MTDARFTGGSGYYASCDVTPEQGEKNNPTAKLAQVFNLLSLRDPTLNATLYEDPEFAALLRDLYVALRGDGDILATIIERAIHKCVQQSGKIPIDEWCVDYVAVVAAARAEVATKARGENPCRVCGETTLRQKVQFRADDDYLPYIHIGCVSVEEEYD